MVGKAELRRATRVTRDVQWLAGLFSTCHEGFNRDERGVGRGRMDGKGKNDGGWTVSMKIWDTQWLTYLCT